MDCWTLTLSTVENLVEAGSNHKVFLNFSHLLLRWYKWFYSYNQKIIWKSLKNSSSLIPKKKKISSKNWLYFLRINCFFCIQAFSEDISSGFIKNIMYFPIFFWERKRKSIRGHWSIAKPNEKIINDLEAKNLNCSRLLFFNYSKWEQFN